MLIRSIEVDRGSRHISQGQTVDIRVYITDGDVTQSLFDPVNIPMITITNPSGTVVVSDAVMTRLSLGYYTYSYQTTISNALGVYTARVTAVSGSEVAITDNRAAFKLSVATTLASFTYFAIQDQTGVVWYWYITNDNVLNWLPAAPVVPGKQAIIIPQATTPHWLEVNNPTPALRYIYPAVTGEATVTASQPSVGAGRVGSPTITAVSGSVYVISLNISDEVILNLV